MQLSTWFNDLKIGLRLSLVFGFILLIVISGFVFTQNRISTISTSIQSFYDHPFTVTKAVLSAEKNIISMHRGMKDVALAKDEKEVNNAVARVNYSEMEVIKQLGIAKKQYLGDPEEINKLEKLFISWKPIREEVIELTISGNTLQAAEITKGKGAQHVKLLEDAIGNLERFADNMADSFTNNALDSAKEVNRITIIIIITILLISIIAATIVTRSITKPLLRSLETAKQISLKNLTFNSLGVRRKDEIGALQLALDTMVLNLKKQFEEIKEGVNVISSSASEIMAMTTQLAGGSSETVSSISETTSTIEEVKQTAEIAKQKANEVADSAQQLTIVSQDGKRSIEETMDGMNKIKQQMESIASIVIQLSEKSQTIGEIANNVNDLAEQSNLLAVNASIEAARAGEHGRGFNVVATEIKNLSERSKESTIQIRGIVSDIQKGISGAVMATEQGVKVIDTGLQLSSDADDVIQRLSQSIEDTAQMNLQIAASSQQQVVGMDQITSAMENIKEASVQNSNSTRQTEVSVSELSKLGDKLMKILNEYKLL
jgi:methyl-accepting chemotaxis protein